MRDSGAGFWPHTPAAASKRKAKNAEKRRTADGWVGMVCHLKLHANRCRGSAGENRPVLEKSQVVQKDSRERFQREARMRAARERARCRAMSINLSSAAS